MREINFIPTPKFNDVLLVDIYDKGELSTMQDFEYQKIAREFI